MTKFDKISMRVYQRLYRKYRGKNFPHALFQKEVSLERMREKMKQLSVDPLKPRKREQTFRYVDVTPHKNEGVLSDFFVNPNEIPKSKTEELNEFMNQPRTYEDIMKKIKEIDENE